MTAFYKKVKKPAVIALILLLGTLLLAGCWAREKTPSQGPDNNNGKQKSSKLGIGLYTGRIDSSSIEVDVAQNISFPGPTGLQAFRLSQETREYLNGSGEQELPGNTRVVFHCFKNDNGQWVITDIKPLSKADLKDNYNRFNPKDIKVGDNIMGLKVASVDVAEVDWSEKNKAIIEFDGKATLEGTYTHYSDSPMLGHEIAFEIAPDSAQTLPKLNFDRRNDWFLFSNHDEAENKLGPRGSSGKVTIVIDNFTIDFRPGTDAYNYATLVKVKQ